MKTTDTRSLFPEVSESTVNSLDGRQIKWFRLHLTDWGKQNLRDFPWRRTRDPYAILIAEFLLQKTDAPTVTPIYEEFLLRYPTMERLLAANIEELRELLDPLGLFFSIAKIIPMQPDDFPAVWRKNT